MKFCEIELAVECGVVKKCSKEKLKNVIKQQKSTKSKEITITKHNTNFIQ